VRFDLTSMLGMFVLMWAASLGCGLAVERVLGLRLPNALLPPLGLCASIVLIYPGYAAGVGDTLAIVLLAAVAIAGLVFAREGLPRRLNPGWPGVAALVVYALFMAPVFAYGHWTWSGYDFVNDSAFEMLLADHVRSFGTVLGNIPESSERQFVNSYLAAGYPLGTQSLLGTYAGILSVPAAVGYQGFISGLAAFTALALGQIASRLLKGARAALIAVAAVAASLTYQYALQGSVKEIGLLATIAATAAVASEALRSDRPYAAAGVVAVCAAGCLAVYSAVAVAFLGSMMLFLAIGVLLVRRLRPSASWVGPILAGSALAGILAIPTLTTFAKFWEVGSGGQAATGSGATQFGQLLRVLPLSQISGVWLAGEYRTPVVPEPAATLTVVATVAILVFAVPGALWALKRGTIGPLLLLGSVGLVLLILFPRVSPYAQGKLLSIGGPAVLFAALLFPALMRGRLAGLGVALLALLAVAVLASDVLAYTRARVAPSKRMEAIADVGHRFRGQGLVMWNEFEEYAKYLAHEARITNPFEALTPAQVRLLVPRYFYGHYFDLDEQQLPYVQQFPLIVVRRSPAASRPPGDYALVYANDYYTVWRRRSRPEVLRHLPLQQQYSPTGRVVCKQLQKAVAAAPTGSELLAPVTPEMKWFEPLYSKDRSIAWGLIEDQPGAVATNGPGHASGKVTVRGGPRYEVWVQGDFPHPIGVSVDGRRLGSVSGSNTPLQWQRVATIPLAPGTHTLRVVRGAGHRYFGPGEFQSGVIGAVAVRRAEPETMQTLPLSKWRSLCGTERDWVEVVRP